MKDLAVRLKVPIAHAVGIMEMLWHYTAKYHPRGDIGSAPDWAIADACGWNCGRRRDRVGTDSGKLAAFIAALVVSKWLDVDKTYRMLVHDWPEHADESVKRLLRDKGLSFITPTASVFVEPLPFLSLSLPIAVASPSKPDGNFSLKSEELEDAWDRHLKHSRDEPKDLAFRVIFGMNGEFNADKFRARHRPYCVAWEGRWQFCPLTFLAWVRAGMPIADEPATEAKRETRGQRISRELEREGL